MIKIFFLFILCGSLIANDKIPQDGTSFDQSIDLFFNKRLRAHAFNFSTQFLKQDKQNNRREFHLGYRYQINNHWKVGGSYGVGYGLRHNEDWINPGNGWQWLDTSDRKEELLRVFAQHKTNIFGKGKFILKNRLTIQKNAFNTQDLLIYRIGVFNLSIPQWTFLHQFDFFIPLNFNRSKLSELWHYSSFMYRYNAHVMFGPTFSAALMKWNESIAMKGRTGLEFTHELTIFRLGMGFIFNF